MLQFASPDLTKDLGDGGRHLSGTIATPTVLWGYMNRTVDVAEGTGDHVHVSTLFMVTSRVEQEVERVALVSQSLLEDDGGEVRDIVMTDFLRSQVVIDVRDFVSQGAREHLLFLRV